MIVLDLNLEVLEQPKLGGQALYDWAVRKVLGHDPAVVAFSSMGVNSHVGLEIARRVKLASPSTRTIFGGPHFGAIAQPLLLKYSWVDAVFTSEAEDTFLEVIERLARRTHASRAVPGVALRQDGRLLSAPRELLAASEIASPDYDLVSIDRYFALNPARMIDAECGRGCIYACSFCYAPRHFGREDRRIGTQLVLNELARIDQLGARGVFFVQDNFGNDEAALTELCTAVANDGPGLPFHCYMTLNRLTDTAATALARAHCRAIYVGVDAVQPEHRRRLQKGFFHGRKEMLTALSRCLDVGIRPTCAFMLDDCAEDATLDQTIAAAAAARLLGCRVRFNTLTLYPGTGLSDGSPVRLVPDALKTRLSMDLPDVVTHNELAVASPELFPFHATHRDPRSNAVLLLRAHALYTLAQSYPQTLFDRAEEGTAWQLLGRMADELDPETFAELPDQQRRLHEVARFAEIAASSRPSDSHGVQTLRAERLVSSLANARPKTIVADDGSKVTLRPFALSREPQPSLLAVATMDGIDLLEVPSALAAGLQEALEALGAGGPPPPGALTLLTSLGIMPQGDLHELAGSF